MSIFAVRTIFEGLTRLFKKKVVKFYPIAHHSIFHYPLSHFATQIFLFTITYINSKATGMNGHIPSR